MSDQTPEKDQEPEDRGVQAPPQPMDQDPDRMSDSATDSGVGSGADPVMAAFDPPKPAPRRRGGAAVLAVLLLGGAATAVAWYDPLGWRGQGAATEIAALTARLDASATAVKALEGRIAQLEAAPAPVPASALVPLEQAVKDTQAALAALQQAPGAGEEVSSVQVAALAQAVEDLKRQVSGLSTGGPVSDEAIRSAVDAAMEARAAEQEAAAKATVEAAQKQAARTEAVQNLRAAARSGAPFADLIPALGDLPLDPILRDAAAAGLPTGQALAESFPEAARKALDAALRATGGEGMGDRLYTFLRIQTGARSLTPQEGTDPDAVLSRAEAAVQAGDIAKALEELAALPPEGQAELADWQARAQHWLAAEKALNDLAAAAAVQGG